MYANFQLVNSVYGGPLTMQMPSCRWFQWMPDTPVKEFLLTFTDLEGRFSERRLLKLAI